MSETKFPPDKESIFAPTSLKSRDTTAADEPKASRRQVIFILASLWISWIAACIADTLFGIQQNFWTGLPWTPLQGYVYRNQWDMWFYRHDPFHVLEYSASLNKICVISLTMCAMFLIALNRLSLDSKDATLATITNVLTTLGVVTAARAGAVEKEAGMIAMPFPWLCCKTVAIYLHMVGVDDVSARFGVNEKVAGWAQGVSLAAFAGTYGWLFGFGNEFVAIMVLWQGIGYIYQFLG